MLARSRSVDSDDFGQGSGADCSEAEEEESIYREEESGSEGGGGGCTSNLWWVMWREASASSRLRRCLWRPAWANERYDCLQ